MNVVGFVVSLLFVFGICGLTVFGQAANNHAEIIAKTQATPQNSPYALKKGTNEFGVWGGGAFSATTIFGGLREDEAKDRGFIIAGLRYGRILLTSKTTSLKYTFDAIPVAIATGSITKRNTTGSTTTFTRENVYGAGITPLGFQLNFARQQRVQPFINLDGGLLFFSKPVPLPESGKFSYVGETGGGVQIFTRERRAVTLGLKFHHISNGGRQAVNRGLNTFVFHIGYSIFK